MTDRYCFDTSSYIELKNKYPRDVFESLWKIFENYINNNKMKSPQLVFDELLEGDSQEDIVKFIKNNKGLLLQEFCEKIDSTNQYLTKKYPEFVAKDTGLVKNDADLFVVSTAKVHNLIVITEEKRKENSRKKIPNICDLEKIECMNLLDMIKREKIKI